MDLELKAVGGDEHSWKERSRGLKGALHQVLALRQYHKFYCDTRSPYHSTNPHCCTAIVQLCTRTLTCLQHLHVMVALLTLDRLRHRLCIRKAQLTIESCYSYFNPCPTSHNPVLSLWAVSGDLFGTQLPNGPLLVPRHQVDRTAFHRPIYHLQQRPIS